MIFALLRRLILRPVAPPFVERRRPEFADLRHEINAAEKDLIRHALKTNARTKVELDDRIAALQTQTRQLRALL